MPAPTADDIRNGVLSRMERQAAMVRWAILGAAAIETLMIGLTLWLIDWQDRTHVLVFVMGVLGYTIVVLGLAALGAHVSRACNRVVAVIETLAPR
jgi:hypothetical protein